MKEIIKKNLESIRTKIANLTNREVKLVAVSKFVEVSKIIEAINCGQKIFGENYVQHAISKLEQLNKLGFNDIEFHLIGALQSNKAKDVIGVFKLIHSVDRIKLAEVLANRASQKGIKQDILLQVNISKEANKSGVLPENLLGLLKEVSSFDSLNIKGLMTIGQEELSEQGRIEEFVEMNRLFDETKQYLPNISELSMGMSSDFELAIQYNASIIRVGTAIFGER